MEESKEKIIIQIRRGEGEPRQEAAWPLGEVSLAEAAPTDGELEAARAQRIKYAGSWLAVRMIVVALLFAFTAITIPSLFRNDWFLNIPAFVQNVFRRSSLSEEVEVYIMMAIICIPLIVGVYLLTKALRKGKSTDIFAALWPGCYFFKEAFKGKLMYWHIGSAVQDAYQHVAAYTPSTTLFLDTKTIQKKIRAAVPQKGEVPENEVSDALRVLQSAVGRFFKAGPGPGAHQLDAYGAQLEAVEDAEALGGDLYLLRGSVNVLRVRQDRYEIVRLRIAFYAVKRGRYMVPVHAVQRLAVVEA